MITIRSLEAEYSDALVLITLAAYLHSPISGSGDLTQALVVHTQYDTPTINPMQDSRNGVQIL